MTYAMMIATNSHSEMQWSVLGHSIRRINKNHWRWSGQMFLERVLLEILRPQLHTRGYEQIVH
jgi:hypothetical protein